MNRNRVIEYYEKTPLDYALVLFRHGNYSMNYGWWDDTVANQNQAFYRINAVIAEKLAMQKSDIVLDAGCGLGESALWFAKHVRCRVVGVSIHPGQVRQATRIASERRLQERVTFRVLDYTKTDYQNNSFDAVVAIETICHLTDKKEFYREAYRILKPGGRIAVAEYIRKREPASSQEKQELAGMLSGWVIPNLWTAKEHVDALKDTGFHAIDWENYSDKTVRVARYVWMYSLPGVPFYWLLHTLGLLDAVRFKNALASRYQWISKKKGLWGHAFFSAEKPSV